MPLELNRLSIEQSTHTHNYVVLQEHSCHQILQSEWCSEAHVSELPRIISGWAGRRANVTNVDTRSISSLQSNIKWPSVTRFFTVSLSSTSMNCLYVASLSVPHDQMFFLLSTINRKIIHILSGQIHIERFFISKFGRLAESGKVH